jgi:hypothetical protein
MLSATLLTSEEIKMLATLERAMDSGEQPYVILAGQRIAFSQEVLNESGVVSGQTISQLIFIHLMQRTLAMIETKIALNKAREE